MKKKKSFIKEKRDCGVKKNVGFKANKQIIGQIRRV